MQLASDLNNREFLGAINPDDQLFVEFYWHEPIDSWESARQQKQIKLPKQPFVRIMKPGDQTLINTVAVTDEHKQRWPQKWLYWQMKEGLVDAGEGIQGWRIEEWPEVGQNPELLRDLQYRRFYVVEQLAGMSDAQAQAMGMIGPSMREKARVALRERLHVGYAAKEQETNDKIAALQAQVEALLAAQSAPKSSKARKEEQTGAEI